jgi:subtilase family serine protease
VPALAAGASSTGNTMVKVPSGTAAGSYYLLACSDDLEAVAESDESNNCRASATKITIR